MFTEIYVQLIKQTTGQAEPNAPSNIQNWRLFAMLLGVCVPRHGALLSLINAHLNMFGLDGQTEEGKFARFCLECMVRTFTNKNRK